MLDQTDMVYSANRLIIPEDYDIQVLSISNNSEDSIVHLARLFSDITMGETVIADTSLAFSKITLEDYTTKYCKLLKDSIVINSIDDKRYVTKKKVFFILV